MGTFAEFRGDMTVSPERLPEFTQRVMEILEQGGMMGIEQVEIFGKRIALLTPLSPGENSPIVCNYNYFEDDAWENAVYNVETGAFFSYNIGCLQFCNTVCVVYALYEFYAKEGGTAYLNDIPLEKEPYIGWLNYLFDENFGGNIEKISTTDLLECQSVFNDDRVFFWTPGGDVYFSTGMELWLKELRTELELIENLADGSTGTDMLKMLMETLDEAKAFGHMYAFREMFYDFIDHPGDPKRHAAVVLLQRMVREGEGELPTNGNGGWFDWQEKRHCTARQRVKRYLAVLGNLELRGQVFDF